MAAEPYETIGFKVPADEIDKAPGKFYSNWNKSTFTFTVRHAIRVHGRTPVLVRAELRASPLPMPSNADPNILRVEEDRLEAAIGPLLSCAG